MAVDRILCAAVIFDLDGVLVDSLALIESILREWAAERGVDPDKTVELSYGRRDIDLVPLVAPYLDAAAEAQRITAMDERNFSGLRPVPGAAALLRTLPPARWAVVTSGTRLVARGRLDAVGLPHPGHLTAAEDIIEGKPDPEGYLRAAGLLGVDPQRCVVVEDAPSGVRAALAAGMRCIGVGRAVAYLDELLIRRVSDLREIEAAIAEDEIELLFVEA